MVGVRTKTIHRGTISHLQMPSVQQANLQTETPNAPQCPPHATAPSHALRPNLSLPIRSLPIQQCIRNQWYPHAQKEEWRTTGLLYLPNPDWACLSPRPWSPETIEIALNSLPNTDPLHALASRSFRETVRKTLPSRNYKFYSKLWNANSLSFSSVFRCCQGGPICEVRPESIDGQHPAGLQ